MPRLRSVIFLFLAMAASLAAPARAWQGVEVRVDPRVELLTVAARLAGFREFDMPNSRSPYSERIEARFAPLKDHPALESLRQLRANHGVSYDAIASLAVHLDGLERLELRGSWSAPPERLDARWDPPAAQDFLQKLRAFAREAKAAEFFEGEREFYATVAERMRARLATSRALEWFDAFFGAKAGARYTAIVGLLCGGGNFGVGVKPGGGQPEEITPVFGCWEFDEAGMPVFGESYLALYVHELCHSYTNPIVDRHLARLLPAGERIYASCAEVMKRQSYGDARIVLYESFVRACVIRCRAQLDGDDARKEQERYEAERGFVWAPELAKLFAEFEADREQWPTFDAFVPRLAEFLDEYAATLPDPSQAPQLVRSTPLNGATDVEASLAELVFEFDRPMRDQSWSIFGRPEDQPKFTGKPGYDRERKVLRVPVQLEPGRTYRFSLNSERSRNFVSEEGVPLAPVAFTFTTAGG